MWDTWNAKSPVAQRDDALAADAALLAQLEAVAPDDRDRFTSAMGPMTLGVARLVYGRLDDEHAPADVHESALPTLRRAFPGP